MRVELKHPGDLSEADLAAWARLRADARYGSPFQAAAFTQIAGAMRPDACVLLGYGEDGAVDVILPLQVAKSGLARSLGAPMCDVNGPLVSERAGDLELGALLADAGIAAYSFSGWPQGAAGSVRGRVREGCAVADLSNGFEAYLDIQRDRFPRHFKKMRRLSRQGAREFGEATVTLGPARAEDLAQLVVWKRTQYIRTRRHDVLGAEWTQGLLARCAAMQTGDFAGVMATLHLGGKLAAAEFGLRSGSTLHGWIAGYDPQFASCSPGLILQERLLEAAASAGVTHAVLGVGETHYKQYYCSWQAPVDEGVVVASGLAGLARGLTGDIWRGVEGGSRLARRARRRLDVILAVEMRAQDQFGAFLKAVRQEPAVASTAAALTTLASVAPPS
jgi:CelD/BcsL family acetyltransferase involved in cellulose biosynthesis